jgi:aspartyl-tRNA(Asn)/glutamyl-tRNA(Gln) amidotransferase subunit A
MCLGAIGSDTGGSIRIPAACCGVSGLKPTYGRVSCAGVIPLSWSLDHVGPLGRSAQDCAIIFDSIATYDPRDPNSISRPAGQTQSILGGEQAHSSLTLQGLKLGIPQDDAVDPLDPEVRQAWRSAVLVLQEAGAQVCDVRLPHAAMELYRTIQKPEATLAHMERGWLREKQELYSEITRTRLLNGLQISAVDYLRAQQQRRAFASSLRATLQPVDALLLPTQPMPAVQISQIGQQITIEGSTEPIGDAMLRLTMPFNLAGLPALAFPCGFNSQKLPLSLQAVG